MRLPDWLIYTLVALAVLGASLSRERAAARRFHHVRRPTDHVVACTAQNETERRAEQGGHIVHQG